MTRDHAMTRTVLDPTSELVASGIPKVDRPRSLDGLCVGLLDITKPRGNVFLDRLSELLSERGARVERFARGGPAAGQPVSERYRSGLRIEHEAIGNRRTKRLARREQRHFGIRGSNIVDRRPVAARGRGMARC